MSKKLKILLFWGGFLFLIILGLYLFIHIAFDGIFTGPFYTKEDLIKNYELKESEILEVKNYFESILPENAIVHIEFNNNDELGIFHVKTNRPYENNWNLKIKSAKTDSLLNDLGWTRKELKILKTKLGNANCISISSRKPITIGWQRSGMGMFFYKIFENNLPDSLISEYNDGCTYIFYRDNVVLEYGGGAIGPQCFPGYERKGNNAGR
jgi:hypothetical protein